MANIARTIQLWTDEIVVVGVVRRINLHALYEFDDGTKGWYYYGTDPTDAGKEPNTADPVTEVSYVQIPNDLDSIPSWQAQMLFYELGQLAGENREGLR